MRIAVSSQSFHVALNTEGFISIEDEGTGEPLEGIVSTKALIECGIARDVETIPKPDGAQGGCPGLHN
jgi:hypothetical protein